MNVEELVNQNYAHFSESDRAVWDYISKHREECESLSISAMAKKCCVSRTAVMRFAQKLGLHGFAELKVYLKLGGKSNQPENLLDQVCDSYRNVIDSVRNKNCDELCAAIDSARQIYICGIGMVQSSVKKEFKRIFMSTGRILYDVPSGQEMFNLIPLMTEDDLCILISVSGENEKMIQMARQLRVRGTRMLSITKNRDNTLARLCQYQLYVEESGLVETPSHWMYESTTSYFILIDILVYKYIEYQNRKENRDALGDAGTATV